MAGEKIMIVDDEAVVHELLTHYLEREGFRVFSVYSGSHVLDQSAFHKPDLILLDILLPGLDGLEICRRLRQERLYTPVIMLTAKDEEIDRILGLEIGADDYVTKPFNQRELLARVKNLLRRVRLNASTAAPPQQKRQFCGWIFDLASRTLSGADGKFVDLTRAEFKALALLT